MGRANKLRKVQVRVMKAKDARSRQAIDTSRKLTMKLDAAKKYVAGTTTTAEGLQQIAADVERSSGMFLQVNQSLGPPYKILMDTSFINQCIRNKLDVHNSILDALKANATIYISDCVFSELEKNSRRFRLALIAAKQMVSLGQAQRVKCMHEDNQGYGDTCLVNRSTAHRVYIVATCDRELRQRLRKIPGVPIMYVRGHKVDIERLPECI